MCMYSYGLFFPMLKVADLIWFFYSIFSFTFSMSILISRVGNLAVTVIETKLSFYLFSGMWRIHFDLTFFRGNILQRFFLLAF